MIVKVWFQKVKLSITIQYKNWQRISERCLWLCEYFSKYFCYFISLIFSSLSRRSSRKLLLDRRLNELQSFALQHPNPFNLSDWMFRHSWSHHQFIFTKRSQRTHLRTNSLFDYFSHRWHHLFYFDIHRLLRDGSRTERK